MTLLPRRQHLKALAALTCATGCASAARAASDKPLRAILPVGPGSGVDSILRAVVPSLVKALDGQPVVVENMPGAGGTIGAQAVIKAAPDGQTIGVVSNNHVVNPAVYKKMPFDAINDITPICVIGATPFVLVVNPAKVSARNARELQALLKARPGAFNYASSGNGTVLQLAFAMFAEAAGVTAAHVPYKGVGPMVTDLLGGQVEMGVLAVPVVQGHLKSGALAAIGITGRRRVASLPDVPTLAEQGFADVDVSGWFAAIGPARLPASEVRRLHDAIVAAFATPESVAAMARQETQINPMSPDASAAFFRSELARYAYIVKQANITID